MISVFLISTPDREFVRAHLGVNESLHNLKEGTRESLLEEVVTTFSLEDDWIMEFDPPCCEFYVCNNLVEHKLHVIEISIRSSAVSCNRYVLH